MVLMSMFTDARCLLTRKLIGIINFLGAFRSLRPCVLYEKSNTAVRVIRSCISQLQDSSTLGVVEAFTEEAPQVRASSQ